MPYIFKVVKRVLWLFEEQFEPGMANTVIFESQNSKEAVFELLYLRWRNNSPEAVDFEIEFGNRFISESEIEFIVNPELHDKMLSIYESGGSPDDLKIYTENAPFAEWTVLSGKTGAKKDLTVERFFLLTEAVKWAESEIERGNVFIRISNRKFNY